MWGTILGVRVMILELRLAEPVRLDQNRLVEIVARLGARGADDLISRTMERVGGFACNGSQSNGRWSI